MVVADIKIRNPNVNSGATCSLNGADFSFVWKNLTNRDPAPTSYDIVEAHYAGFENPTLVINGYIDVDNVLSNTITQSLLMDYAQVKTGDTKLVITHGVTGGTILKGRPTAGYSIGGTYTDYVLIQIDGFNYAGSAQESREGHFVRYSIQAHETK